MARKVNQKFKLYCLYKIMLEKTDENHGLTMNQIISELSNYEISAERKSLYLDLHDLSKLGLEITTTQEGKKTLYSVSNKKFELPELKLLVDAIQSSKFITLKKSNELIKKLEDFCSEHEKNQLQRQVFVQDRIKTMNESIYYSVDTIHNAIAENKQIKFKYFRWNIKKEQELTHDGQYITVSPWALIWAEENYYLVAYDEVAEKIKHYRVDKMLKISMTNTDRAGKQHFAKWNTADYTKKNFGMFGGQEMDVTISLENRFCGIFIDRFGKDINFIPIDETHSKVHLVVAMSEHFLSWVFALGDAVKIIGSPDAVKMARDMANRLVQQYEG